MKPTWILAVIIGAVLVLAACSGGEVDTAATQTLASPTTKPATATPIPATATPDYAAIAAFWEAWVKLARAADKANAEMYSVMRIRGFPNGSQEQLSAAADSFISAAKAVRDLVPPPGPKWAAFEAANRQEFDKEIENALLIKATWNSGNPPTQAEMTASDAEVARLRKARSAAIPNEGESSYNAAVAAPTAVAPTKTPTATPTSWPTPTPTPTATPTPLPAKAGAAYLDPRLLKGDPNAYKGQTYCCRATL